MDLMYETLTEKNFLLYCAKAYENPACHSMDEFLEDIKRIKYIRKAATRYETTQELKERLVLNHVTILLNVFGPVALPRILFFKLRDNLEFIKPFLLLLNVLPPKVYNLGKEKQTIDTDDISIDLEIVRRLREI